MEWIDTYRHSKLIVGGFVVAIVNGGLIQNVDWYGECLMPCKDRYKWRQINGKTLEETKELLEVRVKKSIATLHAAIHSTTKERRHD